MTSKPQSVQADLAVVRLALAQERHVPHGQGGFTAEQALQRIEEQLEAFENALQRIYWLGCSGEVEEIIIGVLTPEQRAAWAKTTSNLGDLVPTRTTSNDVGDSNPAKERP